MNTAEALLTNSLLRNLLAGLVDLDEPIAAELNVRVAGIQMDSRVLNKGDLFLACFGKNHDARDYIPAAIELGVAAVLAESGGQWQGIQIVDGVPVIAVDDLSSKISELASRFYGLPSAKLSVIGITGTNGKTSCCQFIAQALGQIGYQCGVIGTLGYGTFGDLKETQLTTPDAVFVQMALAGMTEAGINPVVMEVSSVGLHQKRVEAVEFETAVFTNLSRDHLDYHNSMESYAATKRRLFTFEKLKNAVVNLDDPYALSILNNISKNIDVYTYSLKNTIASVYARELKLTRHGYEAVVCTPLGEGVLKGTLIGYFNLSNLLGVIATLLSYLKRRDKVDLEKLLAAVAKVTPVNGRMEIIGQSDELTTVVDYAHTPDGLKCALLALHDHFEGNIWCVFGCGGNRDKGKRPIMGEVAQNYADRVIITDDNPRNEKGDVIVEHILSGISDRSGVEVIRDRAQAIEFAIDNAAPGDVILVAGKGHETYQDVAGKKMIFSDANHVRLALQKRNTKNADNH